MRSSFKDSAVKQADTLGMIYTPQCVVNFMVQSVEEILKQEFWKDLERQGSSYHRPVCRYGKLYHENYAGNQGNRPDAQIY